MRSPRKPRVIPARPEHEPHPFDPSRANHTMCAICACTLGKSWHVIIEVTDAPSYETTALIPRRSALDNFLNVPIARPARVFRTRPMPTAECYVCGGLTPWRCWQCERPTCPMCAVSMYALCQACRLAYRGPIYALQKQSDVYITAEFERMFV